MKNDMDYSLRFPDPLLEYYEIHKEDPFIEEDIAVDEGFAAEIKGERYFIHARATLPLTEIDAGIGFGIWVEVSPADYQDYLEAVDHDDLYRLYEVEGILANDWPGFPDTMGLRVKIRTVRLDEKVYITEFLDSPANHILQKALFMDPRDAEQQTMVKTIIDTYFFDMTKRETVH